MKLQAGIVTCLFALFVTGCTHKTPPPTQPLAPPIEEAPQPPPSPAPKNLPPPVVSVPAQKPAPDTTAQTPPPKPPVKHKKPPAAKPAQQASNEAPEVSAIGQLSSGAPQDLRQRTAASIDATERSLNGLGRSLNDQEKKTAAQIREYLKQARQALASGDVDGAHTLVVKAKVLLSELANG
jgi:hypothetical protein